MTPGELNKRITVAVFLGMEGGTKRHVWGPYDLYLSRDCVFERSGFPTLEGKETVLNTLFPDPDSDQGIVKIKVDCHKMEAVGDLVFTERTDRCYDAQGTEVLTVKVCGIMEWKGGKIMRWADHFDPTEMLALHSDPARQAAE